MKNYQSNYRAIFGLMPYALAVVIILAGVKECKGQQVGAGATIAKIKGLEMSPGYFVSVNKIGKLNDYMGFGAIVQLSNYHLTLRSPKASINYYTIEPMFFYSIYPVKEFNFNIGTSVNSVLYSEVEGEKFKLSDKTSMYWMAGITAKVGERLFANAKFKGALVKDISVFNWTADIGLSYRITK